MSAELESAVLCRLGASAEPLELVGYDGKLFRFRSGTPFAPGQPLRVEAQFQSSITLELKSIGSVKRADGAFEVRARATTLSRTALENLTARFVAR